MNYGLQKLNTLPLSLRLMREIHDLLLQGVRGADRHPGEFRTVQNWIGNPGGTIKTARFVPPTPTDMNRALNNLEVFIHSEKAIPILLRLGLVHAQFETIHSFLITFILCYEGILRKMDKYQRNRRFVYAEYLAIFDDTVLSITDKTLPEDEEETYGSSDLGFLSKAMLN